MKYIIHLSTQLQFTYFSKSLQGAKMEAGRRAKKHNFIVNEDHHIYIYQFDGVLPIAEKTHKGWINHLPKRSIYRLNNHSTQSRKQ